MRFLNVLNIEDSVDDYDLILRHLKKSGYEVYSERVETAETMKAALSTRTWDVIISDYRMPYFSGLEAFAVLKESELDIPFIIISGTIGEDTAVDAMLRGVNDYMMKNNLSRLIPAIERETQEVMNRQAKQKAEESLRESENRLKLALTAAGMGVWEWNLVTNDVFWSPECYEIAGVGNFDGTFEKFACHVHPDHIEALTQAANRAVAENTLFEIEFKFNKPGGETIWLANYGKVDYDEKDQPLRMVGTVRDITARKKAEEELRQSEERFRSLVSAVSQIVWTTDADGNLKTAHSPKDEQTLTNDAVMTEWMTHLHPDDRDRAVENFRQAIGDKKKYIDEYRLLNASDNTYHYFVSRGTPVLEKDGTIREWVGALTDITQRKLAENSLRESEEKFRALVKATSQFVWSINEAGESEELPEWWSNLTGQAIEECLDGDCANSIHPDDRNFVKSTWERAFGNKTSFDMEYRILTKEKTYRHFAVRGVRVFNGDGTFRQWVGTFTDITERKRAETALQESEEHLRQAQKLESIGRLAGGVAHDFNNMLTAINGYSDLTLRSLRPDDPLRGNLEEIKKAGERSAQLTRQLLAFSRQQILQERVLEMNQVIVETGAMLQRVIGEDFQLTSVLDPNAGKIKADPGQLSQVLMNLVVNSSDSMPKGGQITIETQNIDLDETYAGQHISVLPGRYVMLAVTDTGSGIDDETMPHIFEPFFTTKGVGKGTGLGLSTVYGIIKQSGGNIWVYSEVGNGTTFKIYFPRVDDEIQNAEKTHSAGRLQKGTETVLLVEDEELVRGLSRDTLESCGYKVIDADNGVEALVLCEDPNLHIDLLLTDVVMPQMGGRELAERLLQKFPRLRVLFTSGYTDDAVVRHGIIAKGTNFIQKPFSLDALSRKVRETLDSE
jgi:PAS domain S-box-containing protein